MDQLKRTARPLHLPISGGKIDLGLIIVVRNRKGATTEQEAKEGAGFDHMAGVEYAGKKSSSFCKYDIHKQRSLLILTSRQEQSMEKLSDSSDRPTVPAKS